MEGRGEGKGIVEVGERRRGLLLQLRTVDPAVEDWRGVSGKEGSLGWGVQALLFFFPL